MLHGDIPQNQREITFKSFRDGNVRCLIATNVAARGLDIPNVDLIIQLGPPKNVDSYIHRSGRTGRAGKKGTCITFHIPSERAQLGYIEREARIEIKKVGPPQPEEIIRVTFPHFIQSLFSPLRLNEFSETQKNTKFQFF